MADALTPSARYHRATSHADAVERLRRMLEMSGRPLEVHARMRRPRFDMDVTGFVLIVGRDGSEAPVRHCWLLSAERRGWLRRARERRREVRVYRLTREGVRVLAA